MARVAKVSQMQLAKELGISQALVSAVLNGHRTGVNPATYERIWKHALKRGYHPKGMYFASSPVARGQQVGFILRAPLRLYKYYPFFGHVQHGLHEELQNRGFATVFLGSEDLLPADKLRGIFAAGHVLRGVVILGEVSSSFLEAVQSRVPRVVAVGARYPGRCHSVVGNVPQAMQQLVAHLAGLGHRRFAWLGGNVGMGSHEQRLAAFRTALEGHGLAILPRYCLTEQNEGERSDGADAVQRLLPLAHRSDFPTALVCYNSTMAAGAVKALERAGWSVPRQVSVASADISRVNTEESPRVTGAGTNPEKMGETAAKLAVTDVLSDGFADLMLPAQLIEGETTGPAA